MYVRVNIGDIKEGKLVVDYSGTNLMKLGYFITMFTLICLFIYFRKIHKCYK